MKQKNTDTKSIEEEISNLGFDEDIDSETFSKYVNYIIEKDKKEKNKKQKHL